MLTLVLTQLVFNRFRSKIRKQAKKVHLFSLNSIIYLLLYIAILTLPVLLTLLGISVVWKYTIIAIYALLVGVLHLWSFYKQVKWAEKGVDILPDIIYTCAIAALGTVTFLAVIGFMGNPYTDPNNYTFVMLPFVLPMFVLKTIFLLEKVPVLDYPKYKISTGDKRVTPEEMRNSKPIAVKLMVPMERDSEELTPVEFKLLSDVEFGINIFQLFRLHKDRPDKLSIPTKDANENEYEFLFYRPPGLLGRKKFIDPEKSIIRNQINTKDTIIFQRHPVDELREDKSGS